MRLVRQVGGYYLAGCVLVAAILVVVALGGLVVSPDLRDRLLLREHDVIATVGSRAAAGNGCGHSTGQAFDVTWPEDGATRTGWLTYCSGHPPRPGSRLRVSVTPSSTWVRRPGDSIYLTGVKAIVFGGAVLAALGLLASLLPDRTRRRAATVEE